MSSLFESPSEALHQIVHIPVGPVLLRGDLRLPPGTPGVVMLVNGRRSSRHSRRNQFVAEVLGEAGIGTLLMDLLTPDEEQRPTLTGVLRSDLALLAQRLVGAARWLDRQPLTHGLQMGFLGSGMGAATAVMAAAEMGERIAAVVSRGGRPDLAGEALRKVKSPTRLIVPGHDDELLTLNVDAYGKLRCVRQLHLASGPSQTFKDSGGMQQVADLSAEWFGMHLGVPSFQ